MSNNVIDHSSQGIVFNIKKYAIHDGPGIRTTVFLKGCPLSCRWCHNPEGISFAPCRITRTVRKNGGGSAECTEIIGREMGVEAVMAEIEKDIIFYDESGGGVTFSGGEPLARPRFLQSLLAQCRKKEIHTAVDTSGYAPEETLETIASLADLFLYDLKIMDTDAHRRFTGVDNHRIHDNLRLLANMKVPVMIRFPLIPGITDADGNIRRIAAFSAGLGNVREVSVLPFHNTGDGKYSKLQTQNAMNGVNPPEPSELAEVQNIFESFGCIVRIGG